ncbi:MAG: 23S rRNA (guanosine(2251)-2'-O)-methyltransferase RlmB [Solitalea-like symbiont of Acarus siro]
MINGRQIFLLGIDKLKNAIDSGQELECVYIDKDFKIDGLGDLKRELSNNGTPIKVVPIYKLNKIARNHNGVISIPSLINYESLENVIPGLFEKAKTPAVVLLDRITDVRNFGAIARSCEAMGIDIAVIPNNERALVNQESIDISTKALIHLKVARVSSLSRSINFLKLSGLQIVGLDEKSDTSVYEVDLSLPTALVIGSEFDGISEKCKVLCDKLVKIPMAGKTQSLNASVAAGIAIYEMHRQRKQ